MRGGELRIMNYELGNGYDSTIFLDPTQIK